jgi:hypothetical protein
MRLPSLQLMNAQLGLRMMQGWSSVIVTCVLPPRTESVTMYPVSGRGSG